MSHASRRMSVLLLMTAGIGPATAPATRPTPAATVRAYLAAIDAQDRRTALNLWNTPGPLDGQYAAGQVDMMLAVARLKHAVAAKWGRAAPYDLQMAVVGPAECGDVSEKTTGNRATVTVASNDPTAAIGAGTQEYPLVQGHGSWLLSADGKAGDRPTQATTQGVYAAGRMLIDLIDRVGKDVQAGKCADTNDVLRHISEGMGALGAE